MKHLKRFNEELRTYTYKKAAKKLAEIGHVNRAKSMENYVKKKEEEERLKSEKESIDRWEKNVSEYSKFGKLKIDVFEKHETGRWMNGKMSGYFYPVLTFDRDSFEDSMYEYTRPNPKKVGNYTQSSEEKSFPQDFNEVVSLSLGLVPVEDEKELLLGLSTLLKSQGYSIIAAYDGTCAVSLAHKDKPDLVILDLGLPAGGGFFVLENLKSSAETKDIPVLILTAQEGSDLEEKLKKMGAAAYFHKPFDPPELLNQIKNILI